MAMRKRSGSGSKRHLKEKVVQIYESFFRGEDLTTDNPTFWDEFFLLKPKIPQLEAEIHKLSTEQLINMKESMNILVEQCIEMLRQDHHIRLLYALQTLSALLITMYQRLEPDSNINIKTIMIGQENADTKMVKLFEQCSIILSGDVHESLKSMVLKLLLIIATGIENIDENPFVEYFMSNCLFEPLIQLLCTTTERQQHGYDVVMLLMFLINYKKHESTNPYVVKLSILDDELALNGYGQVITTALNDYVMSAFGGMQGNGGGGGWLSSLTSMVGGIFLTNDEQQPLARGQRNNGAEEGMLLAMYEASHLNRNFMTTLAHSSSTTASSAPPSPPATLPPHQSPPNLAQIQALDNDQPTNLLVTFFQYCSIIMADTRSESSINKCSLCFITLTCIVEDQFANSIMHDQNLTFKVQLYRLPMRHRKIVLEEPPSQPLASTLIDLLVEFIMCHLLKKFPGELYSLCVGVLLRLLSYQKRCKVRLARDWRPLWAALIALLKFLVTNETALLKRHNIFIMAQQVVNIFNLFITLGDTFLPTPASYDQLYYELIRMHQVFDNLFYMALRYSTGDGEYKAEALRLANCLVNVRAIIQHFSVKIEAWLDQQNLSTPSEEQILEVVRKNYDSLILKLQKGLESYERYSEQEHWPLLARTVRAARRRGDASALQQHSAAALHHYTAAP
ncbi:armadillo-like helical domain-containing protein 3 [Bombyx mandarina]|uniref:Armadillo-like helical domain-containing protein 3 n=1 Tax=Bombyx mandarina TaxID=7092 RepID=A0A6J2JUX1_BOMMA|nr:armadillo-like helical domain-containing protein 3 [Bombyx mandarina]XP_028033636.1 armadillo-like helical domain-containing protein 3 [Bombyx mandarina]